MGEKYPECPYALQCCCHVEGSNTKPCVRKEQDKAAGKPNSFEPKFCTYSMNPP